MTPAPSSGHKINPLLKALTKRELEVATLVAQNLADKEIAAKLNISTETVKRHTAHAFKKTGLDNRTQLARVVLNGKTVPPKMSLILEFSEDEKKIMRCIAAGLTRDATAIKINRSRSYVDEFINHLRADMGLNSDISLQEALLEMSTRGEVDAPLLRIPRLTMEDMAIIGLVKNGETNKVIADILFDGKETVVKDKLRDIFRITGASNRTELSGFSFGEYPEKAIPWEKLMHRIENGTWADKVRNQPAQALPSPSGR